MDANLIKSILRLKNLTNNFEKKKIKLLSIHYTVSFHNPISWHL